MLLTVRRNTGAIDLDHPPEIMATVRASHRESRPTFARRPATRPIPLSIDPVPTEASNRNDAGEGANYTEFISWNFPRNDPLSPTKWHKMSRNET